MRRLGIVGIVALSLLGCVASTDLDSTSPSVDRAADTSSSAAPVSEPKPSAACAAQSANSLDGLPDQLDCTGLYADIRTKKVAASAQRYVPAVTLWSDGAEKNRWIYLPKGQKIDASTPSEWTFPVGTKFWKEFKVGGRRIETRLFEKTRSDKWVRTTYQWNKGETAATRSGGGDIDVGGTTWHLPTARECDQCHQGRQDRALGFEQIALGLPGADGLTLAMLIKKNLISPAPEQTQMQIVDDGTGVMEPSVIGWLHINCGVTCHNDNPNAAGKSTLLRLRLEPSQLSGEPASDYAALRTTVGVKATTVRWNDQTRIVAGSPDQSLLYKLVSSRGGGENDQMPPIASAIVDQEYVTKIADWIRAMPAQPAPSSTGGTSAANGTAGAGR
jgi:hypothetical protein